MDGHVTHVESDEEFEVILATTDPRRLIVVDFFATWCGPCVRIAPQFAQLSVEYSHVTFLKVDVDRLTATAASRKINAMPTFHLYKGNRLVSQFTGASIPELLKLIRLHAEVPDTNAQIQPPKSKYTHFPLKAFVFFDNTGNISQIEKKILEFNSDPSLQNPLTKNEIVLLQKTLSTIGGTSFYHASSFDGEEYGVLLKILQWPANLRFPVLDILRMAMLHPVAAEHYAESYDLGKDDSCIDIAVSYLVDDQHQQQPSSTGSSSSTTSVIMIWRLFANLFKWKKAREKTLNNLWTTVLDFAERDFSSTNKQIRLAVATTLLNYCVWFVEVGDSDKKKCLLDFLTKNIKSDEDYEILCRMVVGIGSLVLNEPLLQASTRSATFLGSLKSVVDDRMTVVLKEFFDLLG